MGFLGFGKKKAEPINLKDYLGEEDINFLYTELQTMAKRVPGETSGIATALAESIKSGDLIPAKESIGMCLSAIKMNQAFKESQAGSEKLLDKLAAIEKQIKGQ